MRFTNLVLTTLSLAFMTTSLAMAEDKPKVPTPYPFDTCLVSGKPLGDMGDPYVMVVDGREIKLCCEGCLKKFEKNKDAYVAKLDAGIQAAAAAKPNDAIAKPAAEELAKDDKAPKAHEGPIALTDATFAKLALKSDKPVLVDFWAPWCGPCRQVGPIVEKLAKEMSDKVTVGKLNVDDNPETAKAYKVSSIPTLLIFKGGKVIATQQGVLSEEALRAFITDHLK